MSALLGVSTPGKQSGGATSTRATRVLGLTALAGLATLLVFAFVFSPADERLDEETGLIIGQFDAVRLLYVHFPSILIAYLAFITCAVASAVYLWKRTPWWDVLAAATGEIGVLFLGLTLLTGMIWGKPIWGAWWVWGDVRLMTTLMLFLMYLGYVAVRALDVDREVRARRAAVVALVSVVNIPIVSRSVEWWEDRTLHQKSSATELKYQNLTLFTLFLGFVVFLLVFSWLLIHRFRVGWLEYQVEDHGYDQAIAERREEALAGVERAIGDNKGTTP